MSGSIDLEMPMKAAAPSQFVVFAIDGQRFALPIGNVLRAVRAVAVTPLPEAPAMVRGIINVHGEVVPVMNMRRRLGLPEREVQPTDQFILATAAGRTVALVCDHVNEMTSLGPDTLAEAGAAEGPSAFIPGILKIGPDLVLLQDLTAFLRPGEQQMLDQALSLRECEPDPRPPDADP